MTFSTAARQQIAMRQLMQPRPKAMNPRQAPSRLPRQGILKTLARGLALLILALLVVSAILGGKNLPAQTPVPQATKPVPPRHHVAARAASTQHESTPEAIAAPPVSPAPIWPADQPPNPARVSWDSRGLEVQASNSSLNQILRQIAAHTGAKLEGLSQDQRVFGSYGPGPGSDVLLKLLDGSGYNVLMTGRRDANAPLEIVLSARSPTNRQTAANNQSRSNSEDDEAGKQREPEPQPNTQADQNPFANGGPPRDQAEFMDEVLHRQQVIDQQQQQQDQQNNPQQ